MISTLLIALFASVAGVSLVSLVDSALRARNSWNLIRHEMVQQTEQAVRAQANVVPIRPVVVTMRAAAMPRSAPRLPQAFAA